jgi:uncharacterized membrane protein YphA (DoxX/SURF4 family)
MSPASPQRPGRSPRPQHPGNSPRQRHPGRVAAAVPDGWAGALGEWAVVAGRVLLGLVLAWFGYHELVRPGLWTGYVPLVSARSGLAVLLVLAHGWILLVLAAALIAGVAPRAASLAAAALLAEIVISLIAAGGVSDLTMRDVGVLGLALCLAGLRHERLVLRG